MDYSSINLFKLMHSKMAFHGERQDQLATNIANVDTPGYKAKDLKQPDFSRMVDLEANRLQVRATNSGHITETASNSSSFKNEKWRATYETTPMENNAVLEQQMMNLAENQMEYQKVTNLYNKVSSLFKTAIGNQ